MGKTPVRWTKHLAKLSLPIPVGFKSKCYLQLKIADAGPPRRDGQTNIEVLLDGQPLGKIPLELGEESYSIPLPLANNPAEPDFRLGEIELIVPTWCPNDYFGTGDNRQLGIMLDWIKLKCDQLHI